MFGSLDREADDNQDTSAMDTPFLIPLLFTPPTIVLSGAPTLLMIEDHHTHRPLKVLHSHQSWKFISRWTGALSSNKGQATKEACVETVMQ